MVKPIATVNVVPDLPDSLKRLHDLAYNMRWSWDSEAIALFRRLDPELWEQTYHNPVALLGVIDQDKLMQLSQDPAFMAHYHRVMADHDAYMSAADTWYQKTYPSQKRPLLAYFSTEFGLAECLQSYSGGLGILSGDHLKSASDLGLPLVGVGLLYQEGYFQQYLNADGYQQESYPVVDYANQPVQLQRDADGKPLKISVPMPGRQLHAQIWLVQVGRVPLYLLDSNIAENPRAEDRNLTDRLYGGDRRQRIRQEILMGIGGIRALELLGKRPDVCHMNEGHSAFLALERARVLMSEKKMTFEQAREILRASTIFTTHTPVPAGLERFGYDLIDEHFVEYWKSLGLTREQFHNLGRETMGDYDLFSMAVLALKMSSEANGVAALHGVVSRNMWQWLYPNVPEHEVPIRAVTNGIHMNTWISREMSTLFDRYLNPSWRTNENDPAIWQDVELIPDSELWRTHERRRERLVAFTRARLREQLIRRGVPQSEVKGADEVLNPDALTIGFARRFATYKRATLIFDDVEKLIRLVNDPERPVQFIFAGKAHPHDEAGKEFIRQIIKMTRVPELRHSLVFLENYDMSIARYLVQGVDVWLNNPRRPKEASGTSGMKVIYNGGLNCSILDGWWDEGYSPDVGWAIGAGEEYDTQNWGQQDAIESQALYNIMEQDIIPLYYERGRDGLPRGWIAKVKASMKKLAPFFNTRRMVQEYAEEYYMPAYARYVSMTTPDYEKGLEFTSWYSNVNLNWNKVKIVRVELANQPQVKVGEDLEVRAVVDLGALKPLDVCVQLYYGTLETNGTISDDGQAIDMQPEKANGGTEHVFKTTVKYMTSGERGISVRVMPRHEYLATPFQSGLLIWA